MGCTHELSHNLICPLCLIRRHGYRSEPPQRMRPARALTQPNTCQSPTPSPASPRPTQHPNRHLVPGHIQRPCPNKTSSYSQRTALKREMRARQSALQLHSYVAQSHAKSKSYAHFVHEGEPRACAKPRPHQTLPWLIRLAWHAAFFFPPNNLHCPCPLSHAST